MTFTLANLSYKHLDNVTIDDIQDINIFIGPNNSGKTTIFRALETLLSGDPPPHSEVYFTMQTQTNDIFSPVRIRRAVTGKSHTGPHQLYDPGTESWAPSHLQPFGHRKPDWGELDTLIAAFRRSFFVWHRRKSDYLHTIQTTESLSSEVENLAARIDHILSTAAPILRQELTSFVNDVIPGLGELRAKRHENNSVQVAFGTSGTPIPLQDLGGGVEQTLAIAVILLAEDQNRPIFIEEPETHLHPRSQRALARQIREHRGTRPVFITTHSPIFMNELSQDARIYSVGPNEGRRFSVTPCITKRRQREILDEIGALPSDLMQTNCAIWVEGPTESIVLRHLIEITTSFREHVDYEFIYSGGALAGFFDGDTSLDQDFRDIFKICRHNFVLFDRDCPQDESPSSSYKDRLQQAVGDNHHFTSAYEFEWYYPRLFLERLWKKPEIVDRLFSNNTAFSVPFYEGLRDAGGPKSGAKRKTQYAHKITALSLLEFRKKPEDTKRYWLSHGTGDMCRLLDKLKNIITLANPA